MHRASKVQKLAKPEENAKKKEKHAKQQQRSKCKK